MLNILTMAKITMELKLLSGIPVILNIISQLAPHMNSQPHRYFMVHKPFNMVSQFISPDEVNLLGDLDFIFPEGTHAIGRLDSHSEGLLLLTTNKKITKLLFQSKIPHRRTYIVQVLNHISEESIDKLRQGVSIHIKGGVDWVTSPCEVELIDMPLNILPAINLLPAQVPHSWLKITLTEGKFHQVRKMVYAVRHKCRRLIRISIEDLILGNLPPGQVKEIPEEEIFSMLKI